MGCRIERFAGLGAGIVGWMLTGIWLVHSRSPVVAAGLLLASSATAWGAYEHSRRGKRYGLALSWVVTPVLLVYGLITGEAGLLLVLFALFTPILGTFLQRSGMACELTPAVPSVSCGPSVP